jgi:predicted lipoprotein
MNYLKYSLPILLSLSLLAACKPGEDPMGASCDFDVAVMNDHLARQLILPGYADLQTQVLNLQQAVEQFSTNPDQTNLEATRTACLLAYRSYQQVAMFGFGPATEQGFDLSERLNTWPTNTQGIADAIATGSTEVDSRFKSDVGFPAMEYLLFGPIGSSDAELIAWFSTDANAAARKTYLLALTTDVLAKTNSVYAAWEVGGDEFAVNTGNDVGSSLSLMTNALNFGYERMKNFKFKLPLGKLDGGMVQPDKVEGLYSGTSVELALTEAKAMRDFYLGVGRDGQDGTGFDDYLRCLQTGADTPDGLLADAIVEQFARVISSLEGLPDPLSETLTTDKAAIDASYLEQQQMVPLLKREMVSAFGVRISYVDNDGD